MTEKIRMQLTEVYRQVKESDKRILTLVGGAGSSKSYSVAQWLVIERLIKPNHRILVTRKTTPSLRLSCYLLIKDILAQLNIPYEENRSEMTITFGSSMMVFKGLDDPSKIRSFDVDTIWAEEATELQYNDFAHLNLILRWERSEEAKKIIMTLNPIDENHWIKTKLVDSGRSDVDVLHSTFEDNVFLGEEYKNELRALERQDKNFYRIYTLGQWGALENKIYTNYDIANSFPDNIGEPSYGLDFGWTNPTSLIKIYIADEDIYAQELIYQSNLSTQDIIGRMNTCVEKKNSYMYGDSEDPRSIDEIHAAGFNIHPAIKGPDSVVYGINTVKRHKLHILSTSTNLIKEINGYSWKTDKNGVIIPEPIKFHDHCLDALRYAVTGEVLKRTKRAGDWIFSKV